MYFFQKKEIAQKYIQWIAAFTMCLLNFQQGLGEGWGSPNISRFLKNDTDIYMTLEEVSWVSSINDLAGVFGSLTGSLCLQFFGPKTTALITFISYFLSWSCILVANSSTWLLIGRFLSGLSDTPAYIVFAIYLSEISKPEIRGTLIAISATSVLPGSMLSSFLESRYSSKICCPIYMTVCLIGIGLLFFVLPESPYFLVKSNKTVKAKKSIAVYFPDEKIEDKLLNMQNFVNSDVESSIIEKFRNIFNSNSQTKKLMFYVVLIVTLCCVCGYSNVQRYMQFILERGNSYTIDPKNAVSYIDITILFLRFFTFNLSDKIGRKLLFVSSAVVVSLSLFILGLYFFLLRSNFLVNNYGWIPLICIFIFKASNGIGMYTAMFVILGELCPPNSKNVTNFLSYFFGYVVTFMETKFHLPVTYEFGEEYIFWIQAMCALLVIPVVTFFLPESKGKKLEEI